MGWFKKNNNYNLSDYYFINSCVRLYRVKERSHQQRFTAIKQPPIIGLHCKLTVEAIWSIISSTWAYILCVKKTDSVSNSTAHLRSDFQEHSQWHSQSNKPYRAFSSMNTHYNQLYSHPITSSNKITVSVNPFQITVTAYSSGGGAHLWPP